MEWNYYFMVFFILEFNNYTNYFGSFKWNCALEIKVWLFVKIVELVTRTQFVFFTHDYNTKGECLHNLNNWKDSKIGRKSSILFLGYLIDYEWMGHGYKDCLFVPKMFLVSPMLFKP
jgi:hypothetical protein